MKQRYFISVIPDEPLYSEIWSLTIQCSEKYHTQAALRSPPHLTVIPPFFYNEEEEHSLYEWLTGILRDQASIPVQLNGFDVFTNRVLFISLIPSEKLYALQHKTLLSFQQHITPLKQGSFHPHITIGFRDWTADVFKNVREEYARKSFREDWIIRHMSVLKHDGTRWSEWRRVDFGLLPGENNVVF